MTTYESFRLVTGWQRPGGKHGCAPVEIVPGVWTATYHDIDSPDKLAAATQHAPIALVVNSALCSCAARTGFFGPGVRVLEVDLEDDPDARKAFDAGKPSQSRCAEPDVPLANRCAGHALPYFDAVADDIDAVLAAGGHVLVHCHASLSRSVALILAYLMRSRRLSLLEAATLVKSKWDATWPCDRFVFELIAYEKHLAAPYAFSKPGLAKLCAASAALGALLALAASAARRGR